MGARRAKETVDKLQEMIDRELDSAGFGKVARSLPPRDPRVDLPENSDATISGLADTEDVAPTLNENDGRRGRDLKATPAFASGNAIKTAGPVDLVAQLKDRLRKSALAKLGSTSPESQIFSKSEYLNRIKMAGFLDSAARFVGENAPAETTLKMVSGFRNLLGQYAPKSLGLLESTLAGRAIQEAGRYKDVDMARRLFESFGGAPTIDPLELASLRTRAELYGDLSKNIFSQSGPALAVGALGGLGAGLGYMATRPKENKEPQAVRLQLPMAYRGGFVG